MPGWCRPACMPWPPVGRNFPRERHLLSAAPPIVTMPPSQEPAPYRGERLRQALAQDLRVAELGLGVEIVDGTVIVTGTVPTEGRRAAVAEVVAELAPGLLVRNDVTVVAPETPGPEELVRPPQ